MKTVAIVGVGLIGGSFGLALRKSGFQGPILGVSSPSAIQAGLECGAISASATLKEAADKADLIYLSQPVDRILETLGWLGPMARPETLITDAGSTKATIVQQAQLHLQYAPFIGGHPLAGKETRGAHSADADLFRNRPYILTPDKHPAPGWFVDLLRAIGAEVLQMSAAEHDATVALTSHLPQLASTALAFFLSNQSSPYMEKVFGSGLRDMTRLALSPSEIWLSILATNQANVRHALQSYIKALQDLEISLDSPQLPSIFQAANKFASDLRKPSY